MFLELSEMEPTTKQYPVKSPPLKSQTYGFGELYAGVHFLKQGYEVIRRHWGKRWNCPGYLTAVKVLGDEAADFICREHPQPPDLFVVDGMKRFFFAEIKLPGDRLNKNQIRFFREIEQFLKENMADSKRAPHMAIKATPSHTSPSSSGEPSDVLLKPLLWLNRVKPPTSTPRV